MLKIKSNLGKVAMIIACLSVTSLMFSCHPAPQKLFDAIEQNDVQQVKALIAKRVDVNASKDNLTVLSMAVKKGSLEVVEELLAAGADVNHQFIIISSGGSRNVYGTPVRRGWRTHRNSQGTSCRKR